MSTQCPPFIAKEVAYQRFDVANPLVEVRTEVVIGGSG